MQRLLAEVLKGALVLLLLMALGSCGGGSAIIPASDNGGQSPLLPVDPVPVVPGPAPTAPKPGDQGSSDKLPDYEFGANVLPQSFELGGSVQGLHTTWSEYDGEMWWSNPVMLDGYPPVPLIEVKVHATGAQDLGMIYLDLSYEADRLLVEYATPGEAFAGQAFGSGHFHHADLTGQPGMLDRSTLRFAAILVPGSQAAPFSGDGVVAKFYFQSMRTPDANWHYPFQPPAQPDCQAVVGYDSSTGALTWGYQLPGDFNQDGRVDIFDLTPLFANFGASAGGPDSIAGVIKDSGSGIVGIGEYARLMQHHRNVLDGYRVYSGSAGDYPDNGSLLGTVAFSSASGDPAVERLRFSFALPAPSAGTSYWVKPCLGQAEGNASTAYVH